MLRFAQFVEENLDVFQSVGPLKKGRTVPTVRMAEDAEAVARFKVFTGAIMHSLRCHSGAALEELCARGPPRLDLEDAAFVGTDAMAAVRKHAALCVLAYQVLSWRWDRHRAACAACRDLPRYPACVTRAAGRGHADPRIVLSRDCWHETLAHLPATTPSRKTPLVSTRSSSSSSLSFLQHSTTTTTTTTSGSSTSLTKTSTTTTTTTTTLKTTAGGGATTTKTTKATTKAATKKTKSTHVEISSPVECAVCLDLVGDHVRIAPCGDTVCVRCFGLLQRVARACPGAETHGPSVAWCRPARRAPAAVGDDCGVPGSSLLACPVCGALGESTHRARPSAAAHPLLFGVAASVHDLARLEHTTTALAKRFEHTAMGISDDNRIFADAPSAPASTSTTTTTTTTTSTAGVASHIAGVVRSEQARAERRCRAALADGVAEAVLGRRAKVQRCTADLARALAAAPAVAGALQARAGEVRAHGEARLRAAAEAACAREVRAWEARPAQRAALDAVDGIAFSAPDVAAAVAALVRPFGTVVHLARPLYGTLSTPLSDHGGTPTTTAAVDAATSAETPTETPPQKHRKNTHKRKQNP